MPGVASTAEVGTIQVEANHTIPDFTNTFTAEVGSPPSRGRRRARTKIGRAVAKNQIPLALAGANFLALINERLAELHRQYDQLNSDDGKAATSRQIADYEDLKHRIKAFLADKDQFAADPRKEKQVVESSILFAKSVRNAWLSDRASIPRVAFNLAAFGAAVGICQMTGAIPEHSLVVAGTLVKPKEFEKMLNACAWCELGVLGTTTISNRISRPRLPQRAGGYRGWKRRFDEPIPLPRGRQPQERQGRDRDRRHRSHLPNNTACHMKPDRSVALQATRNARQWLPASAATANK